MRIIPPLTQGQYYHIYNRGTNGESIFREEKNYDYFLTKWFYYIPSVADTFAYSLLDNHFHAFVKIKEGELTFINKNGLVYPTIPELQFSHLLNGYAQGFNKTYNRTGSLFEHPFRRELIKNKIQLINTLGYILFNPQKHEFAVDFRTYPYSSYLETISEDPSFIHKAKIFEWLNGKAGFIKFMDQYESNYKTKIMQGWQKS